MTPPPAGSWIRKFNEWTGWTGDQWHLFTGDMTWRPTWPEPSLEAACGYATGSPTHAEQIRATDREPAAPCQRCLALAGRMLPAR